MLVVDGRINRAVLNYNQLKTEQLTVVPKDCQDEFTVLVIDDGHIELDVLEGTVGKPNQWLEHEAKARGLRVQDVFYGI